MMRGRGARDGKKRRLAGGRTDNPSVTCTAGTVTPTAPKKSPDGSIRQKAIRPPKKAVRICEEMGRYGFELIRRNGAGHLVFAKPGTPGELTTASTPRSPSEAVKRVRSAVRRLLRNNTRAETNL